MELSPQTIRTTDFKTVKKGYDPGEVDDFKQRVAAAIETAQNQATAMEARARAAVAKLQEVSQQSGTGSSATPAGGAGAEAGADDAENISRTLLLAQRTADTTVAEARSEAEAVTSTARSEASAMLDTARSTAAKMIEDARVEGRRSSEEERLRAEGEVQALLARRDFLVADVDQLEQHMVVQRDRLRDAAASLHDLVDRVPGGLGDLRRPLLSASADEPVSTDAPASGSAPAGRPRDTVQQLLDPDTSPSGDETH